MEALVINLDGQSYTRLRDSIEDTNSRVYLKRFRATTPETLDEDLKEFPWFKWTWPLAGQMEGLDLKTGVYKFVYQAENQQKKIACSVSHMRAWKEVIKYGRPMYIFESDAVKQELCNPIICIPQMVNHLQRSLDSMIHVVLLEGHNSFIK